MEPIIKMDTRILRPQEYRAIHRELKPHLRIYTDGLLFSHMRHEEYRRFILHPEWYKEERGVIDLPKGSILKVKARQQERTVLLSYVGRRAIEELIRSGPAPLTRKVYREDLIRAAERAGITTEGISPKMLRKTYISWLMAVKPDHQLLIALSAGHDTKTMARHYLNIGLNNYKEEIKPFTMGWNE